MATCPLTRDEILDMILANLPEDKHIVGAVSGPTGTTLTRNDGQEFFVPVPNSNLIETDNNYIIEFNGESIVIPKCFNRFLDCDGNVIDNCRDRMVTCENLDDRGYLTRVATTDVISGTGTPADPVRFNCTNAELILDPENHQVLLCGPQGVKKIDPDDLLSELCFTDVPDMGTVCGLGEQLVLFNDNGCKRLGRVTTSSARSNTSEFADMVPALPENTGGYVLPQDFPIPNDVYTISDYLADGGTDTTKHPDALSSYRAAPGLNASRIQNSRLARFTGTLECTRTFDWTFIYARGETFSTYTEADSARFSLGSRFRIRPQGGSWTPWLYPFAPGPGNIVLHTTFNGFEVQDQYEGSGFSFPAGDYELEFFYVGAPDPINNLSIAANTNLLGYAAPSPRVIIKPRVIA